MSHWCKHTGSLDPAMGRSGIEALRRKIRRFRIWKISEVHTQDGFSTKFHGAASRSITDHHNHTITTQRQHKRQNTITTQACQSAAREDPSSLSCVLCPVAANVYKLAASLLPRLLRRVLINAHYHIHCVKSRLWIHSWRTNTRTHAVALRSAERKPIHRQELVSSGNRGAFRRPLQVRRFAFYPFA